MTEPAETTPGEQQGSQQQAPEGFIEKARYTGAIQKIEALTNAQKSLNDELATKSSSLEQLNQRLAALEADKTSAVGQFEQQLTDAKGSLSALQTENAQLKAFKQKADVAKSMGRPDLLTVLDHLPAFDNEDALKAALTDLASFADGAATAREAQIRMGVTTTQVVPPQSTAPASPDAWIKHIEGLPIGSTERQAASDRFGDWLQLQNQS